MGYGGTLALRGEITVGELAAFILYLGMFFGPIQIMGDLYNALLSTAASAERRRSGHRQAELQELAAVYLGPQLVVEVTLDRVRHVTPPFS